MGLSGPHTFHSVTNGPLTCFHFGAGPEGCAGGHTHILVDSPPFPLGLGDSEWVKGQPGVQLSCQAIPPTCARLRPPQCCSLRPASPCSKRPLPQSSSCRPFRWCVVRSRAVLFCLFPMTDNFVYIGSCLWDTWISFVQHLCKSLPIFKVVSFLLI